MIPLMCASPEVMRSKVGRHFRAGKQTILSSTEYKNGRKSKPWRDSKSERRHKERKLQRWVEFNKN